jgi:peptide/nickel transport system ATP-binding protein
MVFQESSAAFDPVYTIGQQITEMILAHEDILKKDAQNRAVDLLDLVKIPRAKQRFKAYPHELSGGMRQRADDCISALLSPTNFISG